MGFDKFTVRAEIIKYGQANFDDNFKDLNPEQIVKLYSYFNMRKHYYSSLYLFERCAWLKKLIAKEGCAKFIDIGCGPATSGIAITDFLFSSGSFVPFDYIGVDSFQSMLNAASDMMDNKVYKKCTHEHYVKNIKSINIDWLLNSSCILLNACYLFASPSLAEHDLVNDVNNLLSSTKNKPRFFFYQNIIDVAKNAKYEAFKNKLLTYEILLSDRLTIKYNNQRNSFYPPVHESVYFEVLKF